MEYDPIEALTKLIMLRYFRKGLKPFILTKLEHRDLELESFDQMIKKTIDVKAKLAFWSCFNTKKIDQYYLQSNQLANSIIAKNHV